MTIQLMIDGIKLLLKDSCFQLLPEVSQPAVVVHREQPELLLLDLNMTEQNTVEQIGELNRIARQLKVVIFTSYNSRSMVKEAFMRGTDAYVLKDTTKKELLRALDAVLQQETYFKKSVHYDLANSNQELDQLLQDAFSKKAELSERELEIIQLIVKGKSSQEIGEVLFISKHTVQTHRKNILRKLKLHSGADIIRFVYEHGLSI